MQKHCQIDEFRLNIAQKELKIVPKRPGRGWEGNGKGKGEKRYFLIWRSKFYKDYRVGIGGFDNTDVRFPEKGS
jgi:hypothetical protein